ncbi:MAG: hypothetical protein HKP49_00055 [Maribacter sp.]|nr:hypothetical protein [Maribacter sp.]
MISFFRRLRNKLLSQNKFYKYLLYAIGEIVLVVIGILIALQINNWNEEQKNISLEKELLEGIHNDLARDTLQINNRFFRSYIDLLQSKKRYDSVVNLDDNKIKIKFLDSLFQRCIRQRNTFFPITGTYKTIINSGLSGIIRDKVLFKRIQELYDRRYEILIASGARIDALSSDIRYKHAHVNTLTDKERLRAYKGSELRTEIDHWFSRMEDFSGNMSDTKNALKKVLIQIEEEIKKMEKD